MRHLLDPYGTPNLILNIFKELKDEIDKKEYKDTFFFGCQKNVNFDRHFYQFMANSFSDLLNFWKCQ